jgi:predicted ester cyclase
MRRLRTHASGRPRVQVPGNGRRITFRIPHVFEFADGRIEREQVWLDGGAIIAQLTA